MNVYFDADFGFNHHFLNEDESKHALRVVRLKKGDELLVVDGKGNKYTCSIKNKEGKTAELEIISHTFIDKEKNYSLSIAIAPTKNIDRFEWFLEKATEIGIDHIYPIFTFHSERKQIKPDRLQKVLISALKQSQRVHLPVLHEAIGLKEIFTIDADAKLIAHCRDGLKASLADNAAKNGHTLILIGPEGDFSNEEIEEALKNDFLPTSLGDSRLRTETAGIIACSFMNFLHANAHVFK